ncbi:acylaminoacyl peptidase [Legionella moravica]|uniref:Acylaminoacyl peptidase n=1 Tax=Legionella moravica TaxID=39962 RepID=A0A378JVG5_9GAMM|nr:S9 family peptidase [Legionella moravica]KTD35225.1 acylaminoacyl peptidase [Legionella moravica]STX62653.1 acylaminoacyl peptidase [Legionella moravica]
MKRIVFCIFFCVCICQNGWTGKRVPELHDLYRIADVSEPDVSPDGQWVAYSVSQLNEDTDSSFSNIWRVSLDGQHTEQLTRSQEETNYLPKWSPDGTWIAYLSDAGEQNTTQIWLMPAKGGTGHQLTHTQGEISDFVWSPDSKSIAFIGNETDNSDDELVDKPIVVNRFQFKADGSGYLTDVYDHLYRVDIADGRITMLTSGEHDEYLPAWSPDGKYIAYVTKRGKDADRHLNYDIYIIEPIAHAKEKQLTHYMGSDMDPDLESNLSWSPDSTKIAYLRSKEDKWIYYSPTQLAVVRVSDGSESIIAPMDKWFYKPKWSPDGLSIYALIEESRTTSLNKINSATGQVTRITDGQRTDMDFVLGTNQIIVLSTDDVHPAELFLTATPLIPLTQHNKKILDEVQFQPAEDIQFKSFDGTLIQGLLVKPIQYQKGKNYPALLNLHGGPVYQFSHEFNFEFQWFAANGYVVIAPNPRGSSGRGFDFAKAIYADWGNLDVKDVLAAVDYAVSLGVADPARLAVGGWSYGGILTDYVIASDTRFKAAFSGAGSANVLSGYGADQYSLEYELELGKPWEHPDLYMKLSYPFMKSYRIKTATLFLCAQLDFNVPCQGSEQLYQALKSLNIPTQLVIYPNEYHSLSVPSYLVDRLQRYTDWMNKYLR